MKAILFTLCLVFALDIVAQKSGTASVRVPDSESAIAIAHKRAGKIYGEKQIAGEEPLHAVLKDGIWTVYGTLCCPDGEGKRRCNESCDGGVVEVRIRRSDGKVLSISHGK